MLLLWLLVLGCTAIASQASSQSVLVLTGDPLVRHTHSVYFSDLASRGYQLTFRAAGDRKLQLREWDDWLYDQLVIFAPSVTEFGGAVDAASILEFVDAGRDVVIAVDSQVSEEMRSLVAELGVDLEARGSALIDHTDYMKGRGGRHLVTASDALVNSTAILGGFTGKAPVLYKGIAATISPESTTATAVLAARDSAFSGAVGRPATDAPLVAGGHAVLVAAVQARNGARVLVSGSLDMFSNAFFTSGGEARLGRKFAQSGNRAFCLEATKWAFHERGVLRVTNQHHNHAGSEEQPGWYRVMDDLEFALDIHELSEGAWQPYRADDVQVEFVMLDPYVRITLSHDGQGHYFTAFKVPDVYGVYKFMVTYHRQGYTALDLSRTVSVRPFRHNEFERFLAAAYPYYASVFSTMAAFFLFGFVFLYHRDK